jgi:hypothetical protein
VHCQPPHRGLERTMFDAIACAGMTTTVNCSM